MLTTVKKLTACTLHAADGDIGKIKGIYFDCAHWKARYCSVKAGGSQVLVPVSSVSRVDLDAQRVDVKLSKEQIRNSPDVDHTLPLSRSMEAEIASHYSSEKYWRAGAGTGRAGRVREEETRELPEERRTITMRKDGTMVIVEPSGASLVAPVIRDAANLYYSQDLLSYDVRAADGGIGDMADLVVSADSWDMPYLVVDAGKIASGKKVLVSPDQIDSVSQPDEEITLSLSRDAVKSSPEYDPSRLDAEYERSLKKHYARKEHAPRAALWRFNNMRHTVPAGQHLRIELGAPAMVRWSIDEWQTYSETHTAPAGGNRHAIEIDTKNMKPGESLHFAFLWDQAAQGTDFSVQVVGRPAGKRERELAKV